MSAIYAILIIFKKNFSETFKNQLTKFQSKKKISKKVKEPATSEEESDDERTKKRKEKKKKKESKVSNNHLEKIFAENLSIL